MRILLLFQEPDLCEAHIFAEIARQGWKITALLAPNARHRPILEAAGIRCISWNLPSRFSFRTIRTLREIMAQNDFDIIHCLANRAISNLLLAGVPAKSGVVVYRGTMGHISRLSILSWFTYLNPRINRIICVSDAVRKYLLRFLSPQKLVRIYKGHRSEWYTSQLPMPRASLHIPPDKIVISCLANMRPVKGVRFLIDAIKILEDKNICLLLVGKNDDSELSKIMQDPNLKDTIRPLGYRTDAQACIACSDIFVMPSVAREGLPKALVEAMSLGIAPVVTDVGGMPEVVQNGISGLVVPPKNPHALAQALKQLITNTAERKLLGLHAKERVQSLLSLDATVTQTLSVYDAVCEEQRARVPGTLL
jgi:glycosyltransferase involved in cell wall biosynthesis